MATGIVTTTPTTTHNGELRITVGDPEQYPNPYKAVVGAILEFTDPGIPIKQYDTVECALTSLKTCNIVKVLEPVK